MTRPNALSISALAAALAAWMLLPPGVCADVSAIERQALERHMSDLTNCLAYYSIAQAALEKAGERATAARLEEVRSVLLDRSFIVMRVVGMSEETALASQKTAMQEQMALIDNDFGKFATLTDRYGIFCKEIVEDPGDRLEQWKGHLRDDARE